MIAMITGASSGIGEALAKNLASRGFNLILVARRADRLKKIKEKLTSMFDIKVKIICADLSIAAECKLLYEKVRDMKIDILINNAGFGLFGKFEKTDLDREMEMIDVNIKAVHILTKLFLRDFSARNYGYILNVASVAGFMAGPLMAAYYASKNYVLQLTRAISQELKQNNINVYVGALCPGPVNTEFNAVAGSEFAVKGATASEVADYALNEMFKGKNVIIPKAEIKALVLAVKMLPSSLALWGTYFVQKARKGDPDSGYKA